MIRGTLGYSRKSIDLEDKKYRAVMRLTNDIKARQVGIRHTKHANSVKGTGTANYIIKKNTT